MKYIVITLSFFILVSCKDQSIKIFNLIDSKVKNSIEYKYIDNDNFNEIATFGDYICFSSKDRLIALNKKNESLTVINQKGRGPKENIQIWKLISRKNKLYSFDPSLQKITTYDKDLNYIASFNLPIISIYTFDINNDNLIVDEQSNDKILKSINLKSKKEIFFFEKIIPQGFQPSAYNAANAIFYKNKIYCKYLAIDTLYTYDPLNLELIDKYALKIDYTQPLNNHPVTEPFQGEFKDGIRSFFGKYKFLDDSSLIALTEGHITLFKKRNNSFVAVNSILLVDDDQVKTQIWNFDIDHAENAIIGVSRLLDYVVKIPLSDLTNY